MHKSLCRCEVRIVMPHAAAPETLRPVNTRPAPRCRKPCQAVQHRLRFFVSAYSKCDTTRQAAMNSPAVMQKVPRQRALGRTRNRLHLCMVKKMTTSQLSGPAVVVTPAVVVVAAVINVAPTVVLVVPPAGVTASAWQSPCGQLVKRSCTRPAW